MKLYVYEPRTTVCIVIYFLFLTSKTLIMGKNKSGWEVEDLTRN